MGGADRVATEARAGGFEAALGPVLEPALAGAADQLAATAGLGAGERRAVLDGLAPALTSTVLTLVNRLLVLELNAARITGKLKGEDSARRWDEFLAIAGEERFWRSYLPEHYPTLMPRLDRVVEARCGAAVTIAGRFARDRDELAPLVGTAPGELTALGMGAGDSHGGQTVSIVRCTGGAVVYKPRELTTDLALSALLRRLVPRVRIEVPAVLSRNGYGWARLVRHRHAADDDELARFYRGIGHWLGVMRLLGGTDMHLENLVACGPTPVVVDCETIFTPHPPAALSGLGAATDRAVGTVRAVLRTGLLPARRGNGRLEDSSATGNLPDQQPMGTAAVIVDGGTDTARLGARPSRRRSALNHPSPAPELHRFWPDLLEGFDEVTDRLVELDRAGELEALLDAFRHCRIRVVTRSTATYGALGWMLWHPVSLHDEPAAVRRATELLTTAPDEPDDPAVVAAEIADLLVDDVPVFTTTPGSGRLDGPRGTSINATTDLVADALHRWRGADRQRERDVVRASLVSAYLDTRWRPVGRRRDLAVVRRDDLERRRRTLAASLVRRIGDTAVRGEDRTANWIAPVRGPHGWYVHPCGLDLYGGLPGIVVLLAGYLHEVRHGRADQVDGLPELLDATLHTARLREDREPGEPGRLPGAYLGVGGRIWSWLTLANLGTDDGVARAVALAERLPDGPPDVFTGTAGAIVPLLRLAETTGDSRWTELAAGLGRRLTAPPDPTPGLPHGVTGVGWALARLAEATGDATAAERASAAFDLEDRAHHGALEERAAASDREGRTLHGALEERAAASDREGRTLHGAAGERTAASDHEDRTLDGAAGERAATFDGQDRGSPEPAAWCHGAVGIGLTAADLLEVTGDPPHRETLRRAAAAGWTDGLGWNHTLCHGDLGTWELLDASLRHGVAPSTVDRETLEARIISGLEEHGPVLPHGVAAPGLLVGLGGIAYQLLRMHPGCDLPSVLLPGFQLRSAG